MVYKSEMDLRRLKYFVVTAEELHFGRAAARLGLSQPPLSLQIQTLEREIGVPLLERDRRHVSLTAAGGVLLAEARKILSQLEAAEDLTRRAALGEHGSLSIGFITPVEYSFLPRVLRLYRLRYPKVALQLREAMSDEQIEDLGGGRLDLGLLGGPVRRTDIEYREVSREPVIAAIPSGHLLARGTTPLHVGRLAGEDVIMFTRHIAPDLFDAVTNWCRSAGFTLRIAQETPRSQTIISLVSAGLGIGIVPGPIRGLQRPGVRYRNFSGSPPAAQICVAWPKTRHSPPADNFAALVAAEA
jgi:DNA-binding transcriptional LysR family regulator